jgi:hypothetical protein
MICRVATTNHLCFSCKCGLAGLRTPRIHQTAKDVVSGCPGAVLHDTHRCLSAGRFIRRSVNSRNEPFAVHYCGIGRIRRDPRKAGEDKSIAAPSGPIFLRNRGMAPYRANKLGYRIRARTESRRVLSRELRLSARRKIHHQDWDTRLKDTFAASAYR